MEKLSAKVLSADDKFGALASADRRRVLEQLRTGDPQEEPLDVEAIAETADARIRYHHVHLPKLDAMGFVEWDRERNEVCKGPAFGQAESLLATVE